MWNRSKVARLGQTQQYKQSHTVSGTNLVFLSAENAMKIRHISSAAPNDRQAPTAHIADKSFVERAETVLMLGVLWSGLAACMLGALSYDIAYWFGGS